MILIFPAAGKGTLILKVTDVPILIEIENEQISAVNLVISKVEVHKAAFGETVNETNETTESNNTSTAGWETVVDESKSFDLLQITGVEEFLGQKELGAGRYTQIRLEVSEGSIIINDTAYNLTIPSKKFKLVRTFTIEANKTTTLVFDFDAAQSIVKAGPKYILKPVINLIVK